MKVRKKPIEVEAWPVEKVLEWVDYFAKGADYTLMELPSPKIADAWHRGLLDTMVVDGVLHLAVITLEGIMHRPDGFLICGVKGEFWPIDTEVFYESYEVV